MKKILLCICLSIFFANYCNSQDYLTSEIISKVINIKFGHSTGSSFKASYNNNSYLITAKHVLKNAAHNQKVIFEYYLDSVWVKSKGTVLLHPNPKIDIAVIDLDTESVTINDTELTTKGIVYGDEGYFLGFPYGLKMNTNSEINSGLPLPFVKKAVLSAFYEKDGAFVLFLDGQNNPGFSGGPIVFRNNDKTKKHKWNIIGVVSAYHTQNNDLVTPFGLLRFRENSGIMIGYGINHAIEIIKNREKNKKKTIIYLRRK